jgi:nucleotide sugar dehydrogenase
MGDKRSENSTDANTRLVRPVRYPQDLVSKIMNGELRVAIYGLGHVGAPLAATWLRAGAHVIGVDNSEKVRVKGRQGKTDIPEPYVNDTFSTGLKENRFVLYDDPVTAAKDSFFKMICVPVMAENATANLGAVENVTSSIAQGLKRGDVVALTPSVPPGTTEDVIVPLLENDSNLKCERDFFVAYNPERVYEGRAIHDIEQGYPAIVAGAGPRSLEIASALYSIIFKKGVIKLSSTRTAEFEKLIEGVYRDVNIALANELAKISERIGVNFWEARNAANSQSYCHLHRPGIGVGGACIPIYPQFVLDIARKVSVDCSIVRRSRQINNAMPSYAVNEALKACRHCHPSKAKRLEDYVVALLGLAFRGGVSDTRLSPTYQVIDELLRNGIQNLRVHDPLVLHDPILSEYEGVILSNDLTGSLKGADLVMIVADHPEYSDLKLDASGNMIVYDGRGILATSNLPKANLVSIGVGRANSRSFQTREPNM